MATWAAAGWSLPDVDTAMTTTSQQTVLSGDELRCLRDCAAGQTGQAPLLEALAAKGMLQPDGAAYVLTPAGQHALHVDEPGAVPGIDT